MTIITATEIHLYVLNPSLLSNEMLFAIEQKMKMENEFNLIVDEIKEYYSLYNELKEKNIINTHILEPLQKSEEFQFRLAALQSEVIEEEPKYINTFANADKLVLTRLFYNQSSKEYEMHVLFEDESIIQTNFKIWLSETNVELITNKYGIAKIKSENFNKSSSISVAIPIANFEVIKSEILLLNTAKLKSLIGNYELEISIVIVNGKTICKVEISKGLIIGNLKAYIFMPEKESEFITANIENNEFSFEWLSNDLFRIILFEL